MMISVVKYGDLNIEVPTELLALLDQLYAIAGKDFEESFFNDLVHAANQLGMIELRDTLIAHSD